MTLTIIIPAYNEEATIAQAIKQVLKAKIGKISKEIIVVNDGSTDKTRFKIHDLRIKNLKIINKTRNQGKGAAIRDAIKIATGDIVIIQDADLEYNPAEYPALIEPVLSKKADVVFGSRFVTTQSRRVLYFWHYLANIILTTCANVLTNINLSDMETCYKVFTKEVAHSLHLAESRFGFEPEFTVKVAKAGWRIYEVGISYSGRSYAEGKKITWKDGLYTLICIAKYALWQ